MAASGASKPTQIKADKVAKAAPYAYARVPVIWMVN